MKKKKSWSKPELIILVRGEPAEMVLTDCKTMLPFMQGSTSTVFLGCQYKIPPAFITGMTCENCKNGMNS